MKAFLLFVLVTASQVGFAAKTFVVAADNSDEAIVSLHQIYGYTVAQIEDRARPCASSSWKDCSHAGFIGETESFVDRLL